MAPTTKVTSKVSRNMNVCVRTMITIETQHKQKHHETNNIQSPEQIPTIHSHQTQLQHAILLASPLIGPT